MAAYYSQNIVLVEVEELREHLCASLGLLALSWR